MRATTYESVPGAGVGVDSEFIKYTQELRQLSAHSAAGDSLSFWNIRSSSYPTLAPLAQDLVCAPASQAFVERIFSVTGLLSSGRRNRMHKSLEMRAFLKLNHSILD